MASSESESLVRANLEITKSYYEMNSGPNCDDSLSDSVLNNLSNEFYNGSLILTDDDLVIIDRNITSNDWFSRILDLIYNTISDGECDNVTEEYFNDLVDFFEIDREDGSHNITKLTFESMQNNSDYEGLIALLLAQFMSSNSDCYSIENRKVSVWNSVAPDTTLYFDFYGNDNDFSVSLYCNDIGLDSNFEYAENDFYDDLSKIEKIIKNSLDGFYYGSLTDTFIKTLILDKPINTYYEHINHSHQSDVFLSELFKNTEINDIFDSQNWLKITPSMESNPKVWSLGLARFFREKIGFKLSHDEELDQVVKCIFNVKNTLSDNLSSIITTSLAESTITRMANCSAKVKDVDGLQNLYESTSAAYKTNNLSNLRLRILNLDEPSQPKMSI